MMMIMIMRVVNESKWSWYQEWMVYHNVYIYIVSFYRSLSISVLKSFGSLLLLLLLHLSQKWNLSKSHWYLQFTIQMSHRNSKIQGWASNASEDAVGWFTVYPCTNQQQQQQQHPFNHFYSYTETGISHTNFILNCGKWTTFKRKNTPTNDRFQILDFFIVSI